VAAILPAWAAHAAPVAGLQYFYTVTFASGAQSAINIPITPVTATGKLFVMQTTSIYRFPSSTSTLQCFIAVPAGASTGYIAVPDIASASDFYPAGTLNFTAYIPATRNAYANCYRTGGSYPAETDYVTTAGFITTP
jgi:hypothetical protein